MRESEGVRERGRERKGERGRKREGGRESEREKEGEKGEKRGNDLVAW